MCPFCVTTVLWIAAATVSTGGGTALAVAKLWNKNTREREQGGRDDKQ
jgi:hypothetical protein